MTAAAGGRGRGGWIAALVLAAVLPLSGLAAQSPHAAGESGWHKFRSATLGFGFAYPPGWTIKSGCHASRRCIGVLAAPGRADDYALAFEVFAGGLERTATDKAIFHRGPDGWIADGRTTSHPAEEFAGDGWRGVRAVVDCGVSDTAGVHAAGECLWVVLSDGRRSVVADTQGTVPITDEIRRIVASVRFIGR
jgi:hypothetical protein